MYRARHFRWIARQALKVFFWALTIGITLVASLLGGTVVSSSGTSSGGFHFRFNVNLSQPSSSRPAPGGNPVNFPRLLLCATCWNRWFLLPSLFP